MTIIYKMSWYLVDKIKINYKKKVISVKYFSIILNCIADISYQEEIFIIIHIIWKKKKNIKVQKKKKKELEINSKSLYTPYDYHSQNLVLSDMTNCC